MIIKRSIHEPIRKNPSFDERWRGDDKGFITAWEVGRERAISNPEIKEAVLNGELPALAYYGGHEKKLQSTNFRYGSFYYYAQLQGIRGEDLDIDFDILEGLEIKCSKTKMYTKFTNNRNLFEG